MNLIQIGYSIAQTGVRQIIWQEGSVTHTQTTLKDKQIKDAIGREKGRSQSSSQMCQASYIYAILRLDYQRLNQYNRETALQLMREARSPMWLYVPPTPNPNMEDYQGLDRAVTTCRLPLNPWERVTSSNTYIQSRHHVYISKRYSQIPYGASTLRMDIHHTRANIRILEQLTEF